MQTKFPRRILRPLQYVAIAASVALMSGCNSDKPIAAVGGATGAQQVLNNPNASPAFNAQAAQQQQIGQLQNQALEQAHEREMASGQNQKN